MIQKEKHQALKVLERSCVIAVPESEAMRAAGSFAEDIKDNKRCHSTCLFETNS